MKVALRNYHFAHAHFREITVICPLNLTPDLPAHLQASTTHRSPFRRATPPLMALFPAPPVFALHPAAPPNLAGGRRSSSLSLTFIPHRWHPHYQRAERVSVLLTRHP